LTCLEQWEQDSLLPTARMLTEGLLARRRVGGGVERCLLGTMVLARWRDDELAAGRTTVLAHWRDD
jgi:hypothetical protein